MGKRAMQEILMMANLFFLETNEFGLSMFEILL